MTPAEIERTRRAIQAVLMVRSGALVLPEDSLRAALAVAEEAATNARLPVEDLLARWDPDPRIGSLDDPITAAHAALDLDELERVRFHIIARRAERLLRKAREPDETLIPTLWTVAHDRAIYEVNTARARALLNGSAEWDDRTWKDAAHAGTEPKA